MTMQATQPLIEPHRLSGGPKRPAPARRPGDRFIAHPIAKDVQARIVAHIERGIHKAGADIMTLTGPSRCGKSEIIWDMLQWERFKKYQAPDGRTMQPIVYVEVKKGETPKSLAIAILKELEDFKPDRGTQAEAQSRAAGLLVERGVQLLVIDETQLLGGDKYDIGDFLRQFVNRPIVPLLLIGLPSVETLIRSNSQVGGRSWPGIEMGAMDWNDREQRSIFRLLVKTLYTSFPSPYDILPTDFSELTRAYYITSGGLIGRVTRLMAVALDKAVLQGATELTPQILGAAYEDMARLFDSPPPNAFRLKFLPDAMKKAANTTGMRRL